MPLTPTQMVYSPIQQGLNNLQAAVGMGGYEDANGNTITMNDLPKEVQIEIQRLAQARDAGGTTQQQTINSLYNPTTREAEMRRIKDAQIAQQLMARMQQRDAGRR